MNREQRRAMPAKRKKFDAEAFIRESNAIEGIYDEAEIKQSLHAWEFLIEQEEISHGVICKVQKMITINQTNLQPHMRGYYRTMSKTNVSVGGRHAPDFSLVDSLMQGWLDDLAKMTPLVAHVRFESIHPFVDGNGRTGRMIYWYHCIKTGQHPFFYEGKKRDIYYRLFDQERVIKLSNNNWGINWNGQKATEQ